MNSSEVGQAKLTKASLPPRLRVVADPLIMRRVVLMKTENESPKSSPRITRVAWGEMEIEGLNGGKDFKLWPGGGRLWDWGETGTHHVPGIQPSDLQELLDHGSRVIVLSRGMQLALKTCPETLQMLEENGIRYHIAETTAAVALYNRLCATEAVGGLFHSTC